MIDWTRFGDDEPLARAMVAGAERLIASMIDTPVEIGLVSDDDEALFARMGELEASIYPDFLAYRPTEFSEMLAQKDTILLVLRIGGDVQGYVFGFADDPAEPYVNGADYYVDDGVVAREWERRGIGTISGVLIFALVRLLGYETIGITTEECDAEGRRLVDWYHELGFEDATTDYYDDFAMLLRVDDERMARFSQLLGVGRD